jgi:KUP system potassium uptake protein
VASCTKAARTSARRSSCCGASRLFDKFLRRFANFEANSIHNLLALALRLHGAAKYDLSQAIYYTGHKTIIASGRRRGLARWREELFAFMHHNAQRPGAYFKIPSAQIMEIGVEFEI